ncbi:MAG: acetate--CoA ligase family protein [Candidatus Aminicenantes bacterium]|nr:acetate--CoA ligase family protein [Candidatus Aminicenantes bacterium]
MSFDTMLRPRSIAVIGASENPSKVGYSVLANLLAEGFPGNIYPINPTKETIQGKKCYPSLEAVPGVIDLAVIMIGRDHVLQVLRDCIKKRVPSVITITAGFGESDEEGKRLHQELVCLVREGKITHMGPNCLGLINPWEKLNAAFGLPAGEPGHIALFSQSGALITAIQDWGASNRLGFSLVASIGNKATLDEVDFLEYLKDEPNTRVIASYLEDISRGEQFMKIAERVAKEKPIVILKAGRTQAGAKAASSHTGSLAGADMAYDCAFARTGVIRVDSIEHLFDVAAALAYQPLPKGDRIVVVTNAGGPGIMMADVLEMAGLKVAELTEETKRKLAAVLPGAASIHDPVDVLGDARGDRYRDALRILVNSDDNDGLIVILTPQKMTDVAGTAEAIVEVAKDSKKPIMACFMGAQAVYPGVKILQENKIPQYPIPERASRAMLEMVLYSRYRSRPPRVAPRYPVNRNPVVKIIKSYRSREMVEIGEYDAKTILRAYNFDLPPATLANSIDEAVRFGSQVGYPLAMKISSPDILHKSDVGGVKVGLENAGEVEDAFELMMLRIKRKKPGAEIRGVLLEKMAAGREVIVGMKKDPQFGPMLMFGQGGIFVEVLKDVTFNLTPLTREEAFGMIRGTRSYKLLTGFRGQPGVDIEAIVDNLVRVSQLVVDFPEIEELDINPLMVGREGDGALVVDARIIISKEGR